MVSFILDTRSAEGQNAPEGNVSSVLVMMTPERALEVAEYLLRAAREKRARGGEEGRVVVSHWFFGEAR